MEQHNIPTLSEIVTNDTSDGSQITYKANTVGELLKSIAFMKAIGTITDDPAFFAKILIWSKLCFCDEDNGGETEVDLTNVWKMSENDTDDTWLTFGNH